MNRGTEEPSSADSENATDLPKNETEFRKGDKERSHGKRRTAREIASMFEQLKQRHILRKKEWAEERESLMMRLQMAEESKNVLSELKEILENLRQELRIEERKRLQLEFDHLNERKNWESEREALLKKIEEGAHESDRDGQGLKKMSEKMMEQANQINALQGTEIELKRQILEKDKQLLRDKKDLHHHFEAEKALWKKKENELNKKIRQLSNGKSSTSSLSPSPGDVQNPTRDFIETEDTTSNDQFINQYIRRNSEEASSYSNFERKALKQIEKIRSDFHEYRQESDSQQTKLSDFKTSTSPSPLPDSVAKTSSSKVPWRTKQRTNTSYEQPFDQTAKSKPFTESSHSLSSADASLSLPSISNVQKLTPIPDRKFKKLNAEDQKIQISEFASSPDVPAQKYIYSDEIDADKTTEETSVTQSGIESSLDTKDQSLIDSLDDANVVKEIGKSGKADMKASSNTNATSTRKSTVARSTSPKLPKLHQQLLFKRDLSTPQQVPSKEIPTNSDFIGSNDFTYSDMIVQSQPTKDHPSTHTPYFAPATGYSKGSMQRKKDTGDVSSKSSSITDSFMKYDGKQNNDSSKLSTEKGPNVDKSIHLSATVKSNRASTNSNITHAPAVHPKPKVSIHKDEDGNIIHVSPAVGKRSKSIENVTPEKQYSIAERMGKAGRDWIRKKLHFKDKIVDENEDVGQRIDKKKGKQKHRRQSSLLKSKRESTSVTSSDESSDGESLIRRNRRKGKSNASGSPAKPKKYTRSKTDGSPKDMKRFLSKFKSSQSSSKKPSVVQKFERQLLENDIWTLKEEDGTIDTFDVRETPMPRKHNFHQDIENHPGMKDNRSLYVQADTQCRSEKDRITDTILANTIADCTDASNISHQECNASSHNTRQSSETKSCMDNNDASEDDNKAERLTVSRLVNRFSTHFDNENEDNQISPIRSSMRKTKDGPVSRSRSLTIYDGIPNQGHFPKSIRRESDQMVYDTLNRDNFTWHDRMIAPTDSQDDDVTNQETPQLTESSRKKFQSLSNFWEDKHSNGNDNNEITKPRKTKLMSEEMKQKTSILENVLSKGPKKSRKYKRADTQPVAWREDSEDDESSSVSGEFDMIHELKNNIRRDKADILEEFYNEATENMHETIPPVTGKFTKPSKPGRLPSRWAR